MDGDKRILAKDHCVGDAPLRGIEVREVVLGKWDVLLDLHAAGEPEQSDKFGAIQDSLALQQLHDEGVTGRLRAGSFSSAYDADLLDGVRLKIVMLAFKPECRLLALRVYSAGLYFTTIDLHVRLYA